MASGIETLIRSTVTKGIGVVADFNRKRITAEGDNPFLTGIHTPMAEETTITDMRVEGTIPQQLDGRYLRIGPNPLAPPNPAAYHWFTGDGMVHGVRLKDGEAQWYRNRWVRSTPVSQALGEEPAPGPRRGTFHSVNTNVASIGGQIRALVEASANPVIIGDDLETIAHDAFGDTLRGAFTAHPHRDPATGEFHAICYDAMDPDHVRHVVITPEGKVRRELRIKVANGPSIHDCMITENYVIIMDLPVTFSMKAVLAGHGFPFRWNPEHRARVGLLPREGGAHEVIWRDVAPCYVFHPANAFEADGKVFLDVCAHDRMFADSAIGPSSQACPFERWVIDPAPGAISVPVERRVIDAAAQEFPRPNEEYIGKPYRFAYTVALPEGGDAAFLNETRLFKHDLTAGRRAVHDFGAGRVPGEFVFVPRDDGDGAEDAGWLIGYVVDTNDQHSELVIIDAQNFAGTPQAVVHIPHRIPPGFHGNWVPAAA